MKKIIVFIAIIGLSACSKKNIETSAQVSMIDGKPAATITVQPKSETKPQISITEDDVRKSLEAKEPPVPVEFDIFFSIANNLIFIGIDSKLFKIFFDVRRTFIPKRDVIFFRSSFVGVPLDNKLKT